MRVLGVALFLAGCAATAIAVRASFAGRGWRSGAAGLATPLTVLLAVTGLLMGFVPRFFTGG